MYLVQHGVAKVGKFVHVWVIASTNREYDLGVFNCGSEIVFGMDFRCEFTTRYSGVAD